MEHDPELCADVIAGGIDKYVKQQGRNTVMQNVEHDEALVGYARVAGPDACPFCKTMSSQGFHFKSRATAMSGSHGDVSGQFHAYCNCGLAVAFKDVKGRIRAEGLDGTDIEDWDPDELYREYQESGWSFGHDRKRENAMRHRGRNHGADDIESFRSLPKSVEVKGIGGNAVGTMDVLNPESPFMAEMSEEEFHGMVELKFGCSLTDGFMKLPMDIKQPLVADLAEVYAEYPDARAALGRIGVSGKLPDAVAMQCQPIIGEPGKYDLVVNTKFFESVKIAAEKYGASTNQIAGSACPSLAYHEGFHGNEFVLCFDRYKHSTPQFISAWESNEIAREIVDDAYARLLLEDSSAEDIETLLGNISEYAAGSRSDAICEAGKEIAVKGDGSSRISQLIVQVLKERLNGLGQLG